MARKSWLSRLNPANWLKSIVDAITPEPSKPARRRRQPPPPPPTPPSRGGGGGIPGGVPEPDDYRPPDGGPSVRDFKDVWDDAGGEAGFYRSLNFFQGLPAAYKSPDEELDVWESFITNMVNDSGYRRGDPANPFWSDIGMSPGRGGGFNWSEWRQVFYGGKHKTA